MDEGGLKKLALYAVLTLTIFLLGFQTVHATVTVCPIGCDNKSIQDAVDASPAGGLILVGDGTYSENIDIAKSVALISVNGSEKTILSANTSSDHVFNITADNVNISGFTIRGASDASMAGVYLAESDGCNISNNLLTGSYYGVAFYKSNSNLINGNNISSNEYGVRTLLQSDNNLIYNNFFATNTIQGAFDACCNNLWNTSKQNGTNIIGGDFLGGNYWEDYLGVDNDRDGIGDTLLPFDYGGFIRVGGDYLPLTTDNYPPTISNVKNATVSDVSAVITWSTNELANSRVKYGTTPGSYNYSVRDNSLEVFHWVVLSGLTPRTTYYYRVKSADANGNSNQSLEYSFTTGNVYTVCKPSGCDYTSIQSAIDDLEDGNRVFVYNGTYNENIKANKSLTIQGQNKDTTTIDCDETGPCVSVEAEGVNITGFTVQNGSYGILVDSQNYTIVRANNVKNNRYSGLLLESSNFGRIGNNAFVENRNFYGIGLRSSNFNTIEGNNVSQNWYGIYLFSSCDNGVEKNNASDNTYYGMYISSSTCANPPPYSNSFIENTASGNYFGIIAAKSNSLNISYNALSSNYYAGIYTRSVSSSDIGFNVGEGGDKFSSAPTGVRVVVNETWQSAASSVSYALTFENLGFKTDILSLNVSNEDGASTLDLDTSSITLEPGESETRTMVVGDNNPGAYGVSLEAVSQNDNTVSDQIKTTSVITGSASNDSYVESSTIVNSVLEDSVILNSSISDSTLSRSIVRNSTISNTSVEDLLLDNAAVSDGVISFGEFTIGGLTYTVSESINLENLVLNADSQDSDLVGVSGTEVEVDAENSNVTLRINAGDDYVGGEVAFQKSAVPPDGTLNRSNNLGGYTSILVSENIDGSLQWVYIVMYYDQGVVDAKDINESSIRVEFYNETSGEWEEITPGGVNVDENYAFANSTHFTVFGLHGNIRPAQVSSQFSDCTEISGPHRFQLDPAADPPDSLLQ
jgi:parallel beta-helix repeat protein